MHPTVVHAYGPELPGYIRKERGSVSVLHGIRGGEEFGESGKKEIPEAWILPVPSRLIDPGLDERPVVSNQQGVHRG